MSDPVVGGLYLIRAAIRSPNYVVGTSGWTVNLDGSAEFNNVTIRGNVVFPDENSILFYTSNPPALDTLLFAISPLAGSDIYGNTWGPGFSIFDGTFGTLVSNWGNASGFTLADPQNQFLAMSLTKVPVRIQSTAFHGAAPAFLQAQNGLVTAGQDTLVISSPQSLAATDPKTSTVALYLTQGASSDGANARFALVDTSGTTSLMQITSTGTTIGLALAVNGKSTLNDQVTISTSNANGAIFIFQNVPTTGNPGTISQSESAAGNGAYAVFVNGDAHSRFVWDSNGKHRWGPGSAGLDVALERTAAGILAVSLGSFAVTTAGSGLQVKEGANAKQGTAVLAAGTVTVGNTAITANSRVFLTIQVPGGAVGAVYVSARVAGTSFTIKSTSATDTSTVAYEIIEPA